MTSLSSRQLGEWVFNELEKYAGSAAEKTRKLERVRFLMEQGADPAWNTDMLDDGVSRSHKGYTLGMAAARCLDTDMIALLASFGVNMSAKDSHDMTPLLYTLQYAETPGCAEAAEKTALALLAAHADVRDEAPIIPAAAAGFDALVKAMIAAGADVNAKNSWGETALTAAVARCKVYTVRILLDNHADADWVSQRSGRTLEDFNRRSQDGAPNVDKIVIAKMLMDARAKNPPKGPKF